MWGGCALSSPLSRECRPFSSFLHFQKRRRITHFRSGFLVCQWSCCSTFRANGGRAKILPQMGFIRTVIVSTNPRGQLRGGEQPVGFDHSALAMHPFGFDRIEPGTLFGQKQGKNAYSFALGFDLLVVLTNPGTHDLAVVPGSIVPDQ